jgi:hypothetical protein
MDDKLFQELEDFDVDQILSEIKKEVHNEIEVDKDTVSEEKTHSEKPAPEQKGADQQTEGKISFSFFTDPIPEQEEEVPPDTLEPYVEEAETETDSFDTNEPVASEKTNIFMELFLPVVGDSAGKLVRKGIVWICLAIILASTVWLLVAGGISGKTVAEPQSNVAVILTDAPSTNLKEGMELVR